ncbi:MAG: c-type cytochrome [Candidatus Omnitrophica bacterium]|nr:c-type cytochrome [Candidatus Omnitrophota bacterium]
MRRGIWNRLFLASSFGLIAFLIFLIGQETLPEWRGVQAEYYRRLAQVTQDPSKARTPLKVQQIHLPEFRRTDRCVTCHVGIDNPKMKDQPQPFAAHPDFSDPRFLAEHPFNEIGCTICHQGQGSATTKKHAHGPVSHWEEPLLSGELTVGACTTCHQNVQGLRGAERLVQAMALFEEKGCIGCHTLHGKGMLVGPELAETWGKSVDQFDFRYIRGEKTVTHWVMDHFRDPQRTVPGYPALGVPESAMPNYELTEEEIRLLTALVLSFHSEEEKEERPVPARYKVPYIPQPAETTFASPVERGRHVFQKYGCAACHGLEGRGGIRNKNMDVGEEVPALLYVSDGYSKDELKAIIREGRYPAKADSAGPSPALWMPSWKEKISEEELDALVEYLVSLKSVS